MCRYGTVGVPAGDGAVMTQTESAGVSEVLLAQQRLNEAALSGDVQVFDELVSQDFVVNLPSNRVAHRDTLLCQFSRI
jgi:hypothetical protein